MNTHAPQVSRLLAPFNTDVVPAQPLPKQLTYTPLTHLRQYPYYYELNERIREMLIQIGVTPDIQDLLYCPDRWIGNLFFGSG